MLLKLFHLSQADKWICIEMCMCVSDVFMCVNLWWVYSVCVWLGVQKCVVCVCVYMCICCVCDICVSVVVPGTWGMQVCMCVSAYMWGSLNVGSVVLCVGMSDMRLWNWHFVELKFSPGTEFHGPTLFFILMSQLEFHSFHMSLGL